MKKKFRDLKTGDVIVLPAIEEENIPSMRVTVNEVYDDSNEIKGEDWFLSYDDVDILITGEYGECPINPDDEVEVEEE